MARRLLTVEHTFTTHNRRVLVLLPGFIREDEEPVQRGDRIALRKPDDSTNEVRIGRLQHLNPNSRNEVMIVLKGMTEGDVPIGTEVWSTGA